MTETRTLDALAAPVRDGAHDFDFLHGEWHVHNRRRRRPLCGSDDWYEFEGVSTDHPLWDGRANIEEYRATLPDGTPLRGLALRLYEPATGRWTIHWSNAVTRTLDAPMIGVFRDGVGEFYGDETVDGKKVLCRFRWTQPSPGSPRWEQAFSDDGGQTWETNWIMTFTRWA